MTFPTLPAHLQRMVLFAVNTGLRDSNVCGLEWSWEVFVPEVGRSVFAIPTEAFKTKRAHVVILNDAAWSIIQTQRGLHPTWVFRIAGIASGRCTTTGWQRARREAGLRSVRGHCAGLGCLTGPPIAGVACSRRGRSLLRQAPCHLPR
ncbi:MAG: hypothetical protein E6H79_06960 [Betaproteobacteria bacterium]|nr:MAG: hypothetical protein E6H79_06960 [Betaproteobacteria bacterium]